MRSYLYMMFFFWLTSFVIATLSYFILSVVLPSSRVFGSWYRMIDYHFQNPIAFTAIPCFFYGIIAPFFAENFTYLNQKKRLLKTIYIILLVVLVSTPFGGMLWHYFDMKAGYFPKTWMEKLLVQGSWDGLKMGWIIIALSFPYNLLGAVVTYYITRLGSELFLKS